MLITLKELLDKAYINKYAIPAVNLINLEQVEGGIKAAEELNSPLIIQIAPIQLKYVTAQYIIPMMVNAARLSSVPICIHYDHGTDFDMIKEITQLGVSSVMIDASALDFDDNVYLTKKVVDLCHKINISTEAELGHVGAEGEEMTNISTSFYTDVDQAVKFVDKTKCDALAIAIGNAHGPYVKEPNIDFDLLNKINNKLNIPLVLHGGSGISDKDFKKAISLGITKVNIASLIHNSIAENVSKINNMKYNDMIYTIKQTAYEITSYYIKLFGSEGKA